MVDIFSDEHRSFDDHVTDGEFSSGEGCFNESGEQFEIGVGYARK